MSSRRTSHHRLDRSGLAAAVLAGLFVAAHPVIAGAVDKPEKVRKADTKREKPAKERSTASNKSVRTQQRTADAFAEKTQRPEQPQPQQDEQPTGDTVESIEAQLADADDRIRREDERHEFALADLRESGGGKQAAKARKALEKEESTHQRRRDALEAERASLVAKLDALKGKSPARPRPDDRRTAAVDRLR